MLITEYGMRFLNSLASEAAKGGESFRTILYAHSHRMAPDDQFTGRSVLDITKSYLNIRQSPEVIPTLKEFKQSWR